MYNVPGLRDTVQNELTGIILNKNTSENMANESIKLINDTERYRMFQEYGLKIIKDIKWSKAIEKCLKVINSL